MQGVKLESGRLTVQINEAGAELARIYDKEREREVLWEARPDIWARHAPLLFPFVGKCYEGKYCHNGTVYPMEQHGFARDRNFELVSLSANEVSYRLKDDAASYEVYPFHFMLEVIHRLEGNRIHIIWKVTNEGDDTMWYMIGGHPAFRVPEGHSIYDYTLKFGYRKRSADRRLAESQESPVSLHYEMPNEDGYVITERQGYLKLDHGKAAVTKGFFKDVLTYIFDDGQVEEVSLLLPGEEPYVTVYCRGIPYLGVWTMEKTHPFICLEPWFGRCADDGYTGELKNRAGVMGLEAGETFQAGYVIEIH